MPYKFIREISESSFKLKRNIDFDHKNNTAYINEDDKSYKIKEGTQDMLSILYKARNIPKDSIKIGKSISFPIFMDKKKSFY